MAYNLTALVQVWKNVSVLEANNVSYAEAAKKLSARLRELLERQKKLRQKIEAGEPLDFRTQGMSIAGLFLSGGQFAAGNFRLFGR